MASNLRVDTILPSSGTTLGIGTGSGTINFLGNSNLTTTGDVTVGGNLGVGGTLTYEDVTNIDSVGVITARSGLRVPAGEISLGTGTPRQKLHINASDSGASNMVFTNTTTGTSAGDGFVVGITGGEDAQLNMQESANLKFSTADTERLRIGSAGQLGIGGANYGTSGQVLTSQGASSAVQWATPSSVTTTSGTMTVGFRDHVANAVSSTTATGYYERIGNMVFCSVDTGAINLSGLNNSQILLLTGCFPITRHASWVMNGVATPVTINSGQNSGGPVIVPRYGYWLSNTSLYFSIPRNNSSADNMTIGMMNSCNSRIYLQYSYKVA